jgi:peptidyl-dipeptidase Dcp
MSEIYGLSNLDHHAIPWDKITVESFLPELKIILEEARKEVTELKKETVLNFKNVVYRGDAINDKLDIIQNAFYSLFYAHNTEDLQAIADEFSEQIQNFNSDLTLDPELFAQIKTVYDNRASEDLSVEEMTILENLYKGFVRNGALLSADDKETLRALDLKKDKLGLDFNKNTLKATNDFKLYVDNKDRLTGIPAVDMEKAKELATKDGKAESWAFTLQYPSLVPFTKYCQDRELRQVISLAASTKATGGEFSNQENVREIVALRHKRAKLLGYKDHGEFVLENSMASSAEEVDKFLNNLYNKAMPFAKKEVEKLRVLAKEDGIEEFRGWDNSYYQNKLREKELNLDEEEVKKYFQVDKCVQGVFATAAKLYNLKFVERKDLPVYHEEVQTFEVRDSKTDTYIGLMYSDLYARDTKSSGAWMMGIRPHGLWFDKPLEPIVSINMNCGKATASTPALMSINDVTTLFHEFGHALHGLFSKCKYKTVSGTNVFRDFVELPSQVLENWVTEKECLDLFAEHYETGEKMPADLIEKIKKTGNFLEGIGTIRQLSFGFLDMAWHGQYLERIEDLEKFEDEAMEKTDLWPRSEGNIMSCAFGHLFSGGYSAGYYSYKWAEVLDADAFEAFKEKGLFDQNVATSFRENVLSKGGSEHPMELYKKFRGNAPGVDALLKRAGFSL